MKESDNQTPKTPVERLEQLLRAVERHRLIFLYWSTASRVNPHAIHSRSGINERLYGDEIRGWKEMVDAIDPAGEFLWTYRRVLDRYAQEAIGRFGPGEGMRPAMSDEDGREVPVEGGTFPYWSLGEGSDVYLEEASDAILEACRDLAEAAHTETVLALVRDASAAARPQHHSRWYVNVVVQWSYLSTLDGLISRIKAMRVELSLPPRPHVDVASSVSASKPDAVSVADVVILFMVARDLVRIRREYPDVLSEDEHKAWLDQLLTRVGAMLTQPGFEVVLTLMKAPVFLEADLSESLGVLMSMSLLVHPEMPAPTGTPAEIKQAVEKTMSTCQATASPPVQEEISRLANLMVVSCRCPTGSSVKEFADPARFVQMLHRYWMLASAMVLTQATVHVGFSPHPLLHLIENLRDRLSTCFSKVFHLDGAGEAQQTCNQLVGLLTEGDIDDLAAVPEWTDGELQKVERFIARARLKVGSRVFELTAAEEFFIEHSEHLIAEHEKRCREVWKQMLARADAQAAERRRADSSPTTPPGSGTAAKPAGTPEQRIARIGPLLASLVAADNGIMSLGARLRSLSARGKAANTHALTVEVQEQLHKWIDPIVQHLKDAETASNGVGPYLVGLIAESVAWEVDTRLAIRTLKDQLVRLIYSNGGENEESFVVGAASSLCDRGQRLQAAFEALTAQAELAPPLSASNGTTATLKVPHSPPVVLGKPGEPCVVNGKQKKALTDAQHAVISALITAGVEGLTKDAIEAERSSARDILKRLRDSDKDWAAVIIMAGQTNGRYRIRQ